MGKVEHSCLDGWGDWLTPIEIDVNRYCAICGDEYEDESELSHRLCSDCQTEAKEQLKNALKQFDKHQLDYLDDALDGVYLSDFLKEA